MAVSHTIKKPKGQKKKSKAVDNTPLKEDDVLRDNLITEILELKKKIKQDEMATENMKLRHDNLEKNNRELENKYTAELTQNESMKNQIKNLTDSLSSMEKKNKDLTEELDMVKDIFKTEKKIVEPQLQRIIFLNPLGETKRHRSLKNKPILTGQNKAQQGATNKHGKGDFKADKNDRPPSRLGRSTAFHRQSTTTEVVDVDLLMQRASVQAVNFAPPQGPGGTLPQLNNTGEGSTVPEGHSPAAVPSPLEETKQCSHVSQSGEPVPKLVHTLPGVQKLSQW
ncbi:unnamed protein product [Mytilus edulis]|uniref:Uncharacterized protein n=1 Tax=Mytilus edulis TaxID=6550 RepID=A0A8S3SFM1_MYTED|nr:unnamed protein product [Mytilus edulis]